MLVFKNYQTNKDETNMIQDQTWIMGFFVWHMKKRVKTMQRTMKTIQKVSWKVTFAHPFEAMFHSATCQSGIAASNYHYGYG